MREFLEKLFSSDFMPHGYCCLWNSGHVWVHCSFWAPLLLLPTFQFQ